VSVKSSRLLSILLLLLHRLLGPPQLRASLAATARALAIRYAADEHRDGD
jgi:hypothetical protein